MGVVVPLMYLSPLHASLIRTRPGGRGRGFAAAGLVAISVVLAGLLSSCSTSVTYAGSSSQDVFYKLPRSWKLYNQTTLQQMGMVNTTANSQQQAAGDSYQLFVSFASPSPHLDAHGAPDLAGRFPWAYNTVESLGGSDAESISLSSLQDLVIPVDTLAQEGAAEQLAPAKFIVDGALRGSRISFEAKTAGGPVSFEQVALLNSPTNEVWLLAAGCSPACFEAHKSVIDGIIKSFTVTNQGGSAT
jgi:hypothetical protein